MRRILLNLGPAREGERLTLNGIPWRIDKLGMFCWLSNPALDEVQRLPIELLLKQVSRPYNLDEPWFPCRKGDYLRLADGSVAQVTHLSSEQVVLANLDTDMTIYKNFKRSFTSGITNRASLHEYVPYLMQLAGEIAYTDASSSFAHAAVQHQFDV